MIRIAFRLHPLLPILALLFVVPCERVAAGEPDRRQAAQQAAVDRVFDLSKLHRIDIVLAEADLPALVNRTDARLRATFTYDGVVLKDIGVRQAGGIWHPYRPFDQKPSLSLKFNEFVKGQTLHGLEKLVLKNQIQDSSLVNEHLAYEVFRRAGLPAARTAFAVVTINGHLNGIYLMREPVNEDFFLRHFGSGNETGNLYEFEYHLGEFSAAPSRLPLKEEIEENRSRADAVRLASIVSTSPDESFAAELAGSIDLGQFLTFAALEVVTSHADGFAFRNNNTYMYALPRTGRFIFVPHGADSSFGAPFRGARGLSNAFQPPLAALSRRVQAVPDLMAKFRAEVARVGTAPVWDQAALLERVAQAGKLFAAAERTGQTALDLARFEAERGYVEAFIRAGGTPRNAVDGSR